MTRCAALAALACLSIAEPAFAQESDPKPKEPQNTTVLDTINVSGDWLGSGLQNSVKTFAGARTVVNHQAIEDIGVRGLTGRYAPRSTILLDGIPLAFAPYGQPQMSFAPISLGNIQSIDVVRSGGSVRYGPQNVGGVINFRTRDIPSQPGLSADATMRENIYTHGGASTQYSTFLGTQMDNGLGVALLYSG
ncbi:TonB-dependent receptor plug domain-containing protein, partial [Burkholderia anthina]|uniref:TonB-dependent receptor plug domain-containing protein n=1 Tax=Burkholderia anthina TaxID=179879 RepID=UPI003C7A9050